MLLRRVTYENLRRNNNRRNSRSDSRKVFALRPETALRIYTYAPDRHSLPVRQTLPPVRKTETEEKTVRRLLLQIPARLRKVLTIINCGEATLLPPRFLFFNPSSQTKTYKLFPSSRAQRGDPEERCANVYANYPVVWQRDCRGRFAPSQRRSFLFRYRVDDVSLLFVDESYRRKPERNAIVFVCVLFGVFAVFPAAAELEIPRTY